MAEPYEHIPGVLTESVGFLQGTPLLVLWIMTLLGIIAGEGVIIFALWRQNRLLATSSLDALKQLTPVLDGVESVMKRSGKGQGD